MSKQDKPFSLRADLWKGWILAAVMVAWIVTNSLRPQDHKLSIKDIGLDFTAFYRAGDLVNRGQSDLLYDLDATVKYDQVLMKREHLPLGPNMLGPALYPPFVSWLFAPLARLPYQQGLFAWWGISGICFCISIGLLIQMLGKSDWRDWALVPALIVVSIPFVQTVLHGQNTCLSLLLVTCAAAAWRGGRGFWAGVAAGLLCFKPQLGAIVLVVMILNLGWRPALGAVTSLGTLLLLNAIFLPGTLSDYVHRLGPNVHHILATHPYLLSRHVTWLAFWQGIIGRGNAGPASSLAVTLALICAAPIGMGLLICAWRNRNENSHDRVIAAVIASAPLLMPYYVDYDLLLLAVPAVLTASELMRRPWSVGDVWLARLWAVLYTMILLAGPLNQIAKTNVTVPLVALLAGMLILWAKAEKNWQGWGETTEKGPISGGQKLLYGC